MNVYWDYNSTSIIAPGVSDAVAPFLAAEFGNPSSKFSDHGARAKAAIENSRKESATFIGASPSDIVFTSGGTESIFAALVGALRARPLRRHVILSDVEHPAVWETVVFLREMCGVESSVLPVDRSGQPEVGKLPSLLRPDTALVTCMLANNETGVLSPVAEIVRIVEGSGVLVHTDAVQAAGKMPLNFAELGVDLMSLSGHKFGALKGAGLLVVRQGAAWVPVVKGGGQESGRRGGTEGVPGIVALGAAARFSRERLENGEEEQLRRLRDRFEREITARLPGVTVNGSAAPRLPNTSSLSFRGILSPSLIAKLQERGITVSAGSACKTTSVEPSHVLQAMGLTLVDCLGTVRFSLGPQSTEGEVDLVLDRIVSLISELREAADQEMCCLMEEP